MSTKAYQGRIINLELFNFKSYRGVQYIGPFKQFTCIIGPNGSGKSNLMDAISFVMGLRAQHLRSTNLAKLIYHGDIDSEPPTYAYVKLVFETPENQQMEFKRQVNSEGKSEYFIDDSLVNATQYDDKLESYGILSKARNFLVFQGDVESIASKSPADLTKLFEKVSKSDEFKKDYDRLKLKMETASELVIQNFQKKKSINQEKTKYKLHKKEAEEFERLAREHASKQTEFVLWRLYHLEAKIAENLNAQQQLEKELEEESDSIISLNTSLAEKKRNLARAKAELIKVQNTFKKHQSNQRTVESKLDVSNVNLSHCKSIIQKIEKQMEEVSNFNDDKRKEIERLEDEIQVAESERDQKLKELESKLGQQRESLDDSLLEEYNQLKMEIGKRSINIQEELDRFQSILESVDEEEKQVSNKIQLSSEKLTNFKKLSAAKQDKLDKITSAIQAKERELREIETEYRNIQQSRVELEDEQMEKRQELTTLRDELRDARIEEDENERDAKMNQALESMKTHFSGVYGKITDLFDVSSKRYEIPVFVALGNRNRNAIITDTEKTAIDCIKYLKEQRVPPMVFIPLDTIQVPKLKEGYRNLHNSNSKLVLDVVSVKNPQFEPALRFALGNTVLFRDMDTAMRVIHEHRISVKGVTEDGTLFTKAGFITGGKAEIEQALRATQLSKKSIGDVTKLKEKRDQIIQRLTEITQDMHKLEKHDQRLKTEIQNRELSLKFMRSDQENAQKELQTLQNELQELDAEHKQYSTEHANIISRLKEAEKKVEKCTQELSKIEDEVLSDFNSKIGYNMREYEHEKHAIRQETNNIQLKYNQIIARLSESLEYAKSQIKEDLELKKLSQTLEKERENEKSLLKEVSETNDKLLNMKKNASALQEELREVKENLQNSNHDINETLKKIQVLHNKQQSLQKRITNTSNTVNLLRSKRSQLVTQCLVEEISLPVLEEDARPKKRRKSNAQRGQSEKLKYSESFQIKITEEDDEDEELDTSVRRKRVEREKMMIIDFTSLDEEICEVTSQEQYERIEMEFKNQILNLSNEIEKLAPSLKSSKRYEGVKEKLNKTSTELEKAKDDRRKAAEEFEEIKERRHARFMEAFNPISKAIDGIYKELTKSEAVPLGGTAYLGLDQEDEPYLAGIKYNAMPPLKRYRDIDQLSGGERTVAALALLFAIHRYRPSPFFILDEVDAALDNVNVNKVAHYIQKAAAKQDCQFIVISLKENFFAISDSLVGVMKDQDSQSSNILSLDLSPYPAAPNGAVGFDTDQESVRSFRSSEISDI